MGRPYKRTGGLEWQVPKSAHTHTHTFVDFPHKWPDTHQPPKPPPCQSGIHQRAFPDQSVLFQISKIIVKSWYSSNSWLHMIYSLSCHTCAHCSAFLSNCDRLRLLGLVIAAALERLLLVIGLPEESEDAHNDRECSDQDHQDQENQQCLLHHL